MTGMITRLVRDKGFGFIKSDVDSIDRFFHRSAVRGRFEDLDEQMRVAFEHEDSTQGRGPRAVDVRMLAD